MIHRKLWMAGIIIALATAIAETGNAQSRTPKKIRVGVSAVSQILRKIWPRCRGHHDERLRDLVKSFD
jgi:hypothetical protein